MISASDMRKHELTIVSTRLKTCIFHTHVPRIAHETCPNTDYVLTPALTCSALSAVSNASRSAALVLPDGGIGASWYICLVSGAASAQLAGDVERGMNY